MCEVMEKYMREAVEESRRAAQKDERINMICKMIRKGFDRDTIMDLDYTEDEYNEAEQTMLTSV